MIKYYTLIEEKTLNDVKLKKRKNQEDQEDSDIEYIPSSPLQSNSKSIESKQSIKKSKSVKDENSGMVECPMCSKIVDIKIINKHHTKLLFLIHNILMYNYESY